MKKAVRRSAIRLFVGGMILGMPFPKLFAAADAAKSAPNSVNAFGCNLYHRLADNAGSENLFFSPFSMESALAMTAEGARGQTAREMAATLHVPGAGKSDGIDFSPLHDQLSALANRLGEKPAPPGVREKIAALRTQLNDTNHKIETTGRFNDEAIKLHQKAEATAAELNKLLAQVDQYEFRSANALWAERTFPIQQAYIDAVAKAYKPCGLFPMDFLHNPDGSRVQINQWVSAQTHDRINDLIAPRQVMPDTRLVLTNAVYFKGEWTQPFDANQTQREDFTSTDGNKSKVPLMRQWGMKAAKYAAFNADGSLFETPVMTSRDDAYERLYPAEDGFLLAELPYKGDDLSMIILLPRSASGLKNLEEKLSAENLATWTVALRNRSVNVVLPKFKLDTSYQMATPLQAMGMRRAFVNPALADGAEFDGISPSPDPAKRLFISAVVHKAFVDVNEKGTEAAAATAVMMAAGSAMPMKVPFVPEFRADRPFMFLINDRATGTAVFIGRVTKP